MIKLLTDTDEFDGSYIGKAIKLPGQPRVVTSAHDALASHAYERAIDNLLHLEQWPPPHELIGYLRRCAEKIHADLLKEAK